MVDLRPGKPGGPVADIAQKPEIVKTLCNRHFGVGGDGVLAILPGKQGDATMRVLNADGTEAEMCGNGIRCVAKVLYETDEALRQAELPIDTGAGLLKCAIQTDGTGSVETVTVDMGKPRLARAEIPMTGAPENLAIRTQIDAKGESFTVTGVSMGNPHAIIFVPSGSDDDLLNLAKTYGPDLETHEVFPNRTNVEFAQVKQGIDGRVEIDLVVWERGVGITNACGTGACATAVAAVLDGHSPPDAEIPVHLPGGTLFIRPTSSRATPEGQRVDPAALGSVFMRGPATSVFASEIDLSALKAPRGV